MASEEQAKKFLDALASAAYDLRIKHGIRQEDLTLNPRVRISVEVTKPESFKNVSAQ